MNSIQRLAANARGEKLDRIPFVPSVYEHGAFLIDKTPSEVCRSADLMVEAQCKAYDIYEHDLISVGLDIYNVEAEALGCKIKYYEDKNVPCIETAILQEISLRDMEYPDPARSGRMPLMLEAVSRLNDLFGNTVPVNGTVVGPYTLAALISGYENFVELMLTEPKKADMVLDFTQKVCFEYACAFIKMGVGISINDSWIAQPVLSPSLYHQFVFRRHKELVAALKAMGASGIGIISGGDTTAICDKLVKTGTSLLMADHICDQRLYKQRAQEAGIVLRGSIDSKLVWSGSKAAIQNAAYDLLEMCGKGGRFILGCGVLVFDTPPENVLALKKTVFQSSERRA